MRSEQELGNEKEMKMEETKVNNCEPTTIPAPKELLEALAAGRKATEKAVAEEKKRQDEARLLLLIEDNEKFLKRSEKPIEEERRRQNQEVMKMLSPENENVNYKKLLLMALLSQQMNEGQCWSGCWKDGDCGLPELNEEEEKELKDLVSTAKMLTF